MPCAPGLSSRRNVSNDRVSARRSAFPERGRLRPPRVPLRPDCLGPRPSKRERAKVARADTGGSRRVQAGPGPGARQAEKARKGRYGLLTIRPVLTADRGKTLSRFPAPEIRLLRRAIPCGLLPAARRQGSRKLRDSPTSLKDPMGRQGRAYREASAAAPGARPGLAGTGRGLPAPSGAGSRRIRGFAVLPHAALRNPGSLLGCISARGGI